MQTGKLTTLAVRRMTKPGRYGDGGNLYLDVAASGARAWVFRFKMPGGKAREMRLGAEADITLVEARDKARDARRLMREGHDPLEVRNQARRDGEGQGLTFDDVAALYIEAHKDGWRNAKHRAQWISTLATYVAPIMGKLPVAKVTVGDVMRVLEPIWKVTPETASRVRGRIEQVLDYGTARDWRTGENPARWRGHLANLLPKRSKIAAVKHHAALPWADCPAFMRDLSAQNGIAALALRFTILTAARTSEVTGATWDEIDLAAKVWTVPAERMKAGVEHRVPLSPAALALLGDLRALSYTKTLPEKVEKGGKASAGPSLNSNSRPGKVEKVEKLPVFPGTKRGAGLSNMGMTMVLRRMSRADLTVHGFRSTFRDWCAETTTYPRDVAEAALAHTVRDKVEAAYRRGDMLERRAKLMAEWATFLARPAEAGSVTPLRRARRIA